MEICDKRGGHTVFEVADELDGYVLSMFPKWSSTFSCSNIAVSRAEMICEGFRYKITPPSYSGGSIRGTTYILPTVDEESAFVSYDTKITKEMSWFEGGQSHYYFKRSLLGCSCIGCISEFVIPFNVISLGACDLVVGVHWLRILVHC